MPHSHTAIRTDYHSLAYPPHKNRPIQPLPTSPSNQPPRGLRRTSSLADHGVQPGTPAYVSPNRHDSFSRSRHPTTPSIRIPTTSSFHNPPTPTASTAYAVTPTHQDFKLNIPFGHTSVVPQLQRTPVSAALPFPVKPQCPATAKNIPGPPGPSPACQPRSLARLRSLSVLRPRGKSKAEFVWPDPPPRMKSKAPADSPSIVRRKKSKHPLPPPFSDQAVVMQVDSGDIDNVIKRAMETRARKDGVVGVSDVYRDGGGRIWLDQDEQWEYAALLTEGESSPPASGEFQWVTFGGNPSPLPAEEWRRGSVSTQGSDLDPNYIVRPLDGDNLAVFGSAGVPAFRPPYAARQLHRSDFSVDAAFSRPHVSPKSTEFLSSGWACAGVRPKGKTTNSPFDVEQARKEFLEASFKPVIPMSPSGPMTPARAVSSVHSCRLTLATRQGRSGDQCVSLGPSKTLRRAWERSVKNPCRP
ncbi:hypothetical protein JVU11DRAFT_6661 [Chiua virens]|nr:hypothetical protein JVU11DRAFT_6661 [Chiua virens]